MKLFRSGAEASISIEGSTVIKQRLVKEYRHPDLDSRLRLERARREYKVLSKTNVLVPKVLSFDEESCSLVMEFIDGPALVDVLDASCVSVYMPLVARSVRQLHDEGIIHGDLTTSNMLVRGQEIVLIDFGLAQFSSSLEDIAVDLQVIYQSLSGRHPDTGAWDVFIREYAPSSELLQRFSVVRSRGKYKKQY